MTDNKDLKYKYSVVDIFTFIHVKQIIFLCYSMEAKIENLKRRVAELTEELAASIRDEFEGQLHGRENIFQNYPNQTRSRKPPSDSSDDDDT